MLDEDLLHPFILQFTDIFDKINLIVGEVNGLQNNSI